MPEQVERVPLGPAEDDVEYRRGHGGEDEDVEGEFPLVLRLPRAREDAEHQEENVERCH